MLPNSFTYFCEYSTYTRVLIGDMYYEVNNFLTEHGEERFIGFRKYHKDEPYETFCNHECFLSAYEPKYMGIEGENWILEKADIDILMELLNKPVKNQWMCGYGEIDFPSTWMYLLFDWNLDMSYRGEEYISLLTPMPDYYRLLEDKIPKYEFKDILTDFDGGNYKEIGLYYFERNKKKYLLFFHLFDRTKRHFGFCRYTDRIDKNHICRISMDEPKLLSEGGGLWVPDKEDILNLEDYFDTEILDGTYFCRFFESGWDLICTRSYRCDVKGIQYVEIGMVTNKPDYEEDLVLGAC